MPFITSVGHLIPSDLLKYFLATNQTPNPPTNLCWARVSQLPHEKASTSGPRPREGIDDTPQGKTGCTLLFSCISVSFHKI